MGGRKEPTVNTLTGLYQILVSLMQLLMTIQETTKDDIGKLKRSYLAKAGHTYGLDSMIGSAEPVGKGYGATTLIELVNF